MMNNLKTGKRAELLVRELLLKHGFPIYLPEVDDTGVLETRETHQRQSGRL